MTRNERAILDHEVRSSTSAGVPFNQRGGRRPATTVLGPTGLTAVRKGGNVGRRLGALLAAIKYGCFAIACEVSVATSRVLKIPGSMLPGSRWVRGALKNTLTVTHQPQATAQQGKSNLPPCGTKSDEEVGSARAEMARGKFECTKERLARVSGVGNVVETSPAVGPVSR